MPGVVDAIWPRSISGASGTERVCTLRIASRPTRSGGCTTTRRSKRPGPQQRLIEDLRAVGGAEHDHAGARVEAVHLGQDLVERLLALVVAAADVRARRGARAADGVELVDEDDRGCRLLGLREQVAHARGADADDHLDELGSRHLEERHAGLAGDRTRQQRLAGPGRSAEQHPARDLGAQRQVLVGVSEEVDDLIAARPWPRRSRRRRRTSPVLSAASTRRARERPNDISPPAPPADAARRMMKTNSRTNSSVGPNPNRMLSISDAPWFGFLALIVTNLVEQQLL